MAFDAFKVIGLSNVGQSVTFQMFDMMGRIVKAESSIADHIGRTEVIFDVHELAIGHYVVVATTAGEVATTRVIVRR